MSSPKIDKSGLFNEILDGQVYPHNEKWYAHLLDQYKLYVEMADRISSRRATANSYFLSVNSAILAFVGYLTSKDSIDYLWLLAFAGVTLSYFWRALIQSYCNLNTAKWLVVHQIEKRLPISPYDAEWEAMGRGKNPVLYKPITHIEVGVPLVFMVLHGVVFLRTFPYWNFLFPLK
jgi:hypothetical protein